MNVMQNTQTGVSPTLWVDKLGRRIYAEIGATTATMSAAEARSFAAQLIEAAETAEPLVAIPGLQVGNADLVPAQHATLGQAA